MDTEPLLQNSINRYLYLGPWIWGKGIAVAVIPGTKIRKNAWGDLIFLNMGQRSHWL